MKTLRLIVLAALFGLLSGLAMAENSTRIPGFTIHHNALATDFLSPEVAKAYDIRRSKNRGMLNVSVIKEVEGTAGTPVNAEVTAYAINVIGQRKDIELREVREQAAIYYIGEYPVADQETLHFYIEVKPEGAERSSKAELTQDFYLD